MSRICRRVGGPPAPLPGRANRARAASWRTRISVITSLVQAVHLRQRFGVEGVHPRHCRLVLPESWKGADAELAPLPRGSSTTLLGGAADHGSGVAASRSPAPGLDDIAHLTS